MLRMTKKGLKQFLPKKQVVVKQELTTLFVVFRLKFHGFRSKEDMIFCVKKDNDLHNFLLH